MKKELAIELVEALKDKVVLNVEEIESLTLSVSKDDLIVAVSNQIFYDIHKNNQELVYKNLIPTIQKEVAAFYEDTDCEDLKEEIEFFD